MRQTAQTGDRSRKGIPVPNDTRETALHVCISSTEWDLKVMRMSSTRTWYSWLYNILWKRNGYQGMLYFIKHHQTNNFPEAFQVFLLKLIQHLSYWAFIIKAPNGKPCCSTLDQYFLWWGFHTKAQYSWLQVQARPNDSVECCFFNFIFWFGIFLFGKASCLFALVVVLFICLDQVKFDDSPTPK